jgi:hypothetical protein
MYGESGDPERYTSRQSNACALLDESDFQKVIQAAELYLSARSALMGFVSMLGNLVQRGMNRIPDDWRDEIVRKVHEALHYVQHVSMQNMDDDPGRRSSDGLYKTSVVITGAVGGVFGLASILAELPVTTGLILRSIADIGRANGERLDDPEFRATCVEVFAYGSPLDEDEEEIAFLGAKIGAAEISELVVKVAARYTIALAPRIAAATVPVVGGGLGAGVNWTYMNFYQAMARVLFMLLPIERKHDPALVRSCFGAVVREMRERQTARRQTDRDLRPT